MMETAQTVGIYSLAYTFATILLVIWNALNNSWLPFFYDFARKRNAADILVHGRNYLELYSVLTAGFMVLAPEVFCLFASREYWEGTVLIPILSLGHYMVFLCSFPINHELFHKNTKATAAGTLVAAVCNIALNIWLIMGMGAMGAAVATMTAHGLQFLLHHICAKRIQSDLPYLFGLKTIAPYFVIVVIAAVLQIVFVNDWWLRWSIGLVLGVWLLRRIIGRKSIF